MTFKLCIKYKKMVAEKKSSLPRIYKYPLINNIASVILKLGLGLQVSEMQKRDSVFVVQPQLM